MSLFQTGLDSCLEAGWSLLRRCRSCALSRCTDETAFSLVPSTRIAIPYGGTPKRWVVEPLVRLLFRLISRYGLTHRASCSLSSIASVSMALRSTRRAICVPVSYSTTAGSQVCRSAHGHFCRSHLSTLSHKAVDPKRIIIAGDSAGGGLSLALMCLIRDSGLPAPAAGALVH